MKFPTLAPLPNFLDLVESLFLPTPQESQFSHPWFQEGDYSFWFSRSCWSMLSLVTLRSHIYGRTPLVMVPDYFCNSSLAPLREFGTKLIFYPVDGMLAPNQETCEKFFVEKKPDLFILVHYFGYPNMNSCWLEKICREQGTWLIEDAAHVLKPTASIGHIGDSILYSPHKLLPIPEGAVLVIRKDGPNKLTKSKKNLEKIIDISSNLKVGSNHYSSKIGIWVIKRFLQKIGIGRAPSRIPFNNDQLSIKNIIPFPQMSNWSRRLLLQLLPKLDHFANQRRENQQAWIKLLNSEIFPSENAVNPLKTDDTTQVPYQAVFLAESADQAQRIYDFMQLKQIPVTTWPDLAPEVISQRIMHKDAIQLRDRGLFLPVHQSIKKVQIEDYIGKILLTKGFAWRVQELEKDDWEKLWEKCPNNNLLQSWEYGHAKKNAENWKTFRLLLLDLKDKPIGLTQVLVKEFPFIGGIARINRGPLLIEESNPAEIFQKQLALLNTIRRFALQRKWWILRIAPEIEWSDSAKQGLSMIGGRWLSNSAVWASGRIQLDKDEQTMLMQLKGKWRNALRKGQKAGVKASVCDLKEENIELLLKNYTDLQNFRKFIGISESMIRNLFEQKESFNWKFNLYYAVNENMSKSDSPIGSLVTIKSGDTCTYLIGTTNEVGRKLQANSVLLWEALLDAKRLGCRWFDIGGLSEETPRGVAEFKRGMNAEPYCLIGEWLFLPKLF